MAHAKYRIEPAKTGRSTCKASRKKIEEGELRFGSFADMMGHPTYQWRKLSCVTTRIARNVEAKVGSLENVDGYSDLSAKQKNEFKEAMTLAKSGKRCGSAKGGGVGKGTLKNKATGTASIPSSDRRIIDGPEQVLPLLIWLGIPEHAAKSYEKSLDEQGFDSKAALLTLTKVDLDQLGVLIGHSRLIMHYISSSNGQTQLAKRRSDSFILGSSSSSGHRSAPSFAQRSAASRRWKRHQESHPEVVNLASKFHRSRSKCLAEETGLGLEEVRSLLRENDEALAVVGQDQGS